LTFLRLKPTAHLLSFDLASDTGKPVALAEASIANLVGNAGLQTPRLGKTENGLSLRSGRFCV
jgi:hypothetical protein